MEVYCKLYNSPIFSLHQPSFDRAEYIDFCYPYYSADAMKFLPSSAFLNDKDGVSKDMHGIVLEVKEEFVQKDHTLWRVVRIAEMGRTLPLKISSHS